jgi:hypothetical protein
MRRNLTSSALDAGFDQILVLLGLSIEPESAILLVGQLADDDGTVETGVLGDEPGGFLNPRRTVSTPTRWSSFSG